MRAILPYKFVLVNPISLYFYPIIIFIIVIFFIDGYFCYKNLKMYIRISLFKITKENLSETFDTFKSQVT